MDYKKTAQLILEGLGGTDNLVSAAHCATRLRLVIASNEKVNKEAIENVEGVKGVFFASGQLQVIIGTGTVNKVFDEFSKLTGGKEVSKEELKQISAAKGNKFQQIIKTLGDVFVPIIPAIVASGLLMGLTEAITFCANNGFINVDPNTSLLVFLKLFSNAAYTFLPILIGMSTAKVFGGNMFLGAVIGMIMVHPELQNAWTTSDGITSTQSVWFGLYEVPMVGYQGSVIPVVISVWLMSKLEKKLHKIVPEVIDLFVTPLVSVLVTAYLALSMIGPVFVFVEHSFLSGVQHLLTLPFGIGGALVGGIYATTVVTGIHHMYTVIDMGQIAQYGYTYWLPIASAANIAQGGAALAVGVRTKNAKLKALAYPAALSAMLGITEPAIFGVNIRYVKPFIGASIGAFAGGLYASLVGLGASATGVTGIFGILLHLHAPLQYMTLFVITLGISFAATWMLGFKEEK